MSAGKPLFTASEDSREELDNDRLDLADMLKEVFRLLSLKPSLEIP